MATTVAGAVATGVDGVASTAGRGGRTAEGGASALVGVLAGTEARSAAREMRGDGVGDAAVRSAEGAGAAWPVAAAAGVVAACVAEAVAVAGGALAAFDEDMPR